MSLNLSVTLLEALDFSVTLHEEIALEVIVVSVPVVEYIFKWTVPTTGNTWTIAIPNTVRMIDTSYGVWASFEDPVGGVVADGWFPAAEKTLTTFGFHTDAVITAGTTIIFTLRDV